MAACCTGSMIDAVRLKPHAECWSPPMAEKPESKQDRLRWEALSQMKRIDSMDTSTVLCPCGSSMQWGQRDQQWPDDEWLDQHMEHLK